MLVMQNKHLIQQLRMNASYDLHTLRTALAAVVAAVSHMSLRVDADDFNHTSILKQPCISALSMHANTHDPTRALSVSTHFAHKERAEFTAAIGNRI
jgi:hypothetical protein